ncbi:hypothetical protein DM877_04260 [Enterobacter cloacae]|uniref:Uncharacterized protein n=1 Tax=Enterobacter cloacae TaxID=550 RepID=A0A4Q2EDG6_ENTCL|nr:hypothetical protein DM877_04260 [Enterobacter cloacae]
MRPFLFVYVSWLLRRRDKFRAEYSDITINLTSSYENLQNERTSKIQRGGSGGTVQRCVVP